MDIVPCPSCGQSSEYTPLWKILHHLRFPDRYFDLVRWNRWAEARAFLNVRIVENRGMVPRLLEMSRVRRLINCIEVLGKRASLVIPFSSMDTPSPEEGGESRPAFPHSVPLRSETDCYGEQIKVFA